MKFKLQRVHYMPKVLAPGILYVSEEFGAVAHLCACGCGSKIRTPLGATEWSIEETPLGPTLYPSVGNWQQTCQSHYIIMKGEVIWCKQWTPEQIVAGRENEAQRRRNYYNMLYDQRIGFFNKVWHWIRNLFGF